MHFILLVPVSMTFTFHEVRIEPFLFPQQWILVTKLVHNVNYRTELIYMYNFYFK
jgi:hypothetical protein